jgi:hypothetical protein
MITTVITVLLDAAMILGGMLFGFHRGETGMRTRLKDVVDANLPLYIIELPVAVLAQIEVGDVIRFDNKSELWRVIQLDFENCSITTKPYLFAEAQNTEQRPIQVPQKFPGLVTITRQHKSKKSEQQHSHETGNQ